MNLMDHTDISSDRFFTNPLFCLKRYSRFWQRKLAILQTLDEGGTAQMRPDPGAETLLKLPGLFELLGSFTQLNQYSNGFVVAWTRTARHCQIDLTPVIVLVIVDILQMTPTGQLLLLALLAFQLGLNRLTFGEQPGVGDMLTRWRRHSGLVLAQ